MRDEEDRDGGKRVVLGLWWLDTGPVKVLADPPRALASYDLSPAEVEAFAGGELPALLIGSASTS